MSSSAHDEHYDRALTALEGVDRRCGLHACQDRILGPFEHAGNAVGIQHIRRDNTDVGRVDSLLPHKLANEVQGYMDLGGVLLRTCGLVDNRSSEKVALESIVF